MTHELFYSLFYIYILHLRQLSHKFETDEIYCHFKNTYIVRKKHINSSSKWGSGYVGWLYIIYTNKHLNAILNPTSSYILCYVASNLSELLVFQSTTFIL